MGILNAKQNKTYIFFIEDDKCNRQILFTKSCKSPDRTKEYKETMKHLSDENVNSAGFEQIDTTFKLAYNLVDKLPDAYDKALYIRYDKNHIMHRETGAIVSIKDQTKVLGYDRLV